VNDGEVLLIGGLNDSQGTDNSSGLFFLPAAWSLKSGTKVETDLVLILSATISKP
jgi:general secretion pathway protein D